MQQGRWKIRQAAMQLLDGKVLACPTDTFWDLCCDPENETSTRRLLAILDRSEQDGLILVAASVAQIEHLLDGLTRKQRHAIVASWPGPATWRIPDIDDQIPSWIKGSQLGVAIRASAHPLVQALCLAFGGPLVSVSANRESGAPLRSALQAVKHLGRKVDGVISGKPGRQPADTRIIDACSGSVVR